ncbi:Clp protease N-terminal domain-containing protein [Actinokineospora diospyrosa]|uniref:Clp amino terminal domain-containing protein, pathogenicity island component n=1 Tax=Actinokineospora diospyrosa TaxID=103728 RepID=A0ABT1IA91_9PSEU|nr:Clp protease N-terminal domain-containing protein [Actinokineospora diospyrosa]MCP2269494.1 Clp amino terminal domain-containing protein, pathogenicity island component [Actinokineospora diospyrosa]
MTGFFEGFTAEAVAVMTVAEGEATRLHHDYLGSVHLLLALAQGRGNAAAVLLERGLGPDLLRERAEFHVRRGVSTGRTPLRVAAEVQRVIDHAKTEATALGRAAVHTDHLLLGLLSEPNCVAARMLVNLDADLRVLRDAVLAGVQPRRAQLTGDTVLDRHTTGVHPEPVIGRDAEVDRVAQALSRRTRRSVLVVGPRGVGKAAIVQGLAHRIAAGQVAKALQGRVIRAVTGDLPTGDAVGHLVDRLVRTGCVLWVLDPRLLDPFRAAAAAGELSVICTATAEELAAVPAPGPQFHTVAVESMSRADTTAVLTHLRAGVEDHYAVRVPDQTIAAVVETAAAAGRTLPGGAIDLLDEHCSRAQQVDITPDLVRPEPVAAPVAVVFDTDMWSLG